MATDLRIAPGVSLPLDAVTRTFGVLGQRGTGKTSAAVVLAEEMVKAGAHVAFLDPVGVHWGITRKGTSAGLPGVVIGGEHGDVPLEESGGQLVAELVVARHWPIVVVDMKLLRKGAQRRFMADFLEGLYFHNRQPLHLFFEEADQALPQTPRGMDPIMGRVLGAGEDIVKLGRSRGLGATLISQRPATVNKNVLEQVETLLLFRLMGPRDRKAAREWVEANADAAKEREVMDSLAGLGLGECWLWSPAWLRTLKQIKVRARRTFDSSATPEVGERLQEPAGRGKIDLDELRRRMADTIERAKAEDPRELRKRIGQLERELKQRPTEKQVQTVTETVEVPVVGDATLDQLSEAVEDLARVAGRIVSATNEISSSLGKLKSRPPAAPVQRPAPARPQPRPSAPRRHAEPSEAESDVTLKAGARRMLSALASLHPAWLTRAQVGTLAKVKHTGGTFGDYLSALRTAGAVEELGSGRSSELRITDRGFELLGTEAPAPATTEELLAMWRDRLKRGARVMLDALVDSYPEWLAREDLAERAGIEVSGGTFGDYLSTLRRAGLIEEDGRQVRAAETLFLGATA